MQVKEETVKEGRRMTRRNSSMRVAHGIYTLEIYIQRAKADNDDGGGPIA